MTENDHVRWNEEVAAYMLGALEPGEAAALERHAEGCERCQAEMRWLTAAVDAIPESVERVEPPPELRARVMSEMRAEAPVGAPDTAPPAPAAPAAETAPATEATAPPTEATAPPTEATAPPTEATAPPTPAAGGPWQRAGAWLRGSGSGPVGLRPALGLAALTLVVAAVAGYAIGGGVGSGSDDGARDSTIAAGKAPGITAEMVDEGDSGTLRLANVDPLPDDKVLEAWVQREGEVEPVRGLFVPDSEGQASTQLPSMDGVEVVMVTAEPEGGSESPTGKPLITIPV